jgi:hypothetical protein
VVFSVLFLQACTKNLHMTRKQAKEFINQQTTKQVQAYLLIGRYSTIPKMDVNCWPIKTEFSEDKKVVMNILKERKFADGSLKTDFNACTKDKEPSSDYLSAIFIQPNKLIEIRCDCPPAIFRVGSGGALGLAQYFHFLQG